MFPCERKPETTSVAMINAAPAMSEVRKLATLRRGRLGPAEVCSLPRGSTISTTNSRIIGVV